VEAKIEKKFNSLEAIETVCRGNDNGERSVKKHNVVLC